MAPPRRARNTRSSPVLARSSTRDQAAAVIPGRDQLKDLIARWCPSDGVRASPVPGISCIKVSRPHQRAKRHWRASFCIIVQGTKEILLEGQVYREREPHYIVNPRAPRSSAASIRACSATRRCAIPAR
ncbi:AraC family transcriptional regulator N-terminal domain-containing protein [Sorangium sp. So ce1078]|uniref:AraC family transcriptional regulator N-terminal domain-containing protein n=1 Tax=Sorangium sp. So ce1078 TaxID=3133329 RepID=UPI003F641242